MAEEATTEPLGDEATVKLRARFEAWDDEHNVCTIPDPTMVDGCQEIGEIWQIAREAIEKLEGRKPEA